MRSFISIYLLFTLSMIGLAQDDLKELESFQHVDSLGVDTLLTLREGTERGIPLIIYTEEDTHGRWMTISFHDLTLPQAIQRPLLKTNRTDGTFELTFADLDHVLTKSGTRVEEPGHFPLQYEISLSDSDRFNMIGKTLPFEQIKLGYSFDSGEYLLEIIYSDKAGVIVSAKDTEDEIRKSVARTKPPAQQPSQIPKSSLELKKMFTDSLIIATISLAVMILLGLSIWLFRSSRKKRPTPDFSDILDAKTQKPAVEAPRVRHPQTHLTPEMRESKIRELMAVDNLTYDEATLRIQYIDDEESSE